VIPGKGIQMRIHLRPRMLLLVALVFLCSCGSNLFQPDRKCGVEDSVVRELTVGNAGDISDWGEGTSAINWSVKVEDVCIGDPSALEWTLSTAAAPSLEVEAWVSYGIRALTVPTTQTEVQDSVFYTAVHSLEMKDQFSGSDAGEFTFGLTALFDDQGSRAADSLYVEAIVGSGSLAAVYRHPRK